MSVGHASVSPGATGNRSISQSLRLEPGRYHRLMQVIGRFRPTAGEDQLAEARDLAVEWLQKKKSWNVGPSQVRNDRPVYLEDEASTRALSIESAPGLWAVRLDDPCAQVPGRQWRVEFVLVEMPGEEAPAFGCTLSVLVPVGNTEPVNRPGIPAVVGMMARGLGLKEAGQPLDGSVWEVDRPHEVDELINLIERPTRPMSVVVVSLPRQGVPFYDPARLSTALAGLCVVATVTPEAAQELTARYGRDLGVFGDALRLFRVGFDADVDDRSRPPLFLSQAWRHRCHAALGVIKSVAMADTVSGRDDRRDIPSFGVIRSIAADQRIKAALQSADTLNTADVEQDIAALRDQAESWERYALAEDQRAQRAEEAQRQTLSRLYTYANQIRKLEDELNALRATPQTDFDAPLEDLSTWATENFTGRLVITNRAARAAAASNHNEPQLILKCVELLAKSYWDMKVYGGAERQAACKQREAELGVRISPSGDAVDMRQYEAEYRVRWEGREYRLDMHLAGSDSRDRQRGLRIYFAWDDEQQLVVVGHLPTHLTSTHT